MPLDASSPRPSLASTHTPESVPVTVAPNLPATLTDHAVPRLTHTPSASASPSPRTHLLILIGLWFLLYVSAAFTPPLLDDADATHAQAAQSMLSTGDWVTLHVDGIRYLEKPPLPYWITAVSLKLFAPAHPPYGRAAAFAVHFPLALTILALALLGYAWARRAFPTPTQHAALYTGLFLLTAAGVFLFTRVFIPDALLSLLLAFTLYAFLRALSPRVQLSPSAQDGAPFIRGAIADEWDEDAPAAPTRTGAPSSRPPLGAKVGSPNLWPYAMWFSLALAVLTKGLVAIIFILATTLVFLYWTRQLHSWRTLRPFTGTLLFLAIAAPWHILAGLRNTGGANGHGFFWFYFINEHVLRFLGRRIPRDYNKLPGYLYWSLHLVWLFPWSLFAPAALITAWRKRRTLFARIPSREKSVILSEAEEPRGAQSGHKGSSLSNLTSSAEAPTTFRHQTTLLLLIFSTLVLAFFSISTNQEYYTFPVYLPLLMLLAAALTSIERNPLDPALHRALTFTFATYTLLGLAIASALGYGLWSSRHLPFVPDIGELLAHRNVGDYTLSMSHFFDLTGPSFAALRLPAALALIAFLTGPAIAWILYARRRFLPAILSIAAASSVFLIAAHIAFVRFNPMLSSVNFAKTIQTLERTNQISPNNIVLIFGDQAFGSSIPFYLDRQVDLVDGRTTSMLFGSTFPDAPHLFLTSADLLGQWGTGPRKLLFVPLEKRGDVDQLLGSRQIILQQTSGKALITDRPLASSF
jgi:4-amino-4-deoxy-L-arabinose transferase-like glycosyltransferase